MGHTRSTHHSKGFQERSVCTLLFSRTKIASHKRKQVGWPGSIATPANLSADQHKRTVQTALRGRGFRREARAWLGLTLTHKQVYSSSDPSTFKWQPRGSLGLGSACFLCGSFHTAKCRAASPSTSPFEVQSPFESLMGASHHRNAANAG